MFNLFRLAPRTLEQRALLLQRGTARGPFRRLASGQRDARSRIERINSRLPKFLRRFTTPLTTAPLTHITAFLLLHEITAVVPLFGLFAYFHQTQHLPAYFAEGKWVSEGVEKFGRYFRKKGWLGEEQDKKWVWWGRGEKGTRVVVEIATAYAITKVLLPLRIIVSVWGTPWFARMTIVPLTAWFWRAIGRKTPNARSKAMESSVTSPAAGTGAIGGGALPSSVPRSANSQKVKNS